jgi:hypothetical protein
MLECQKTGQDRLIHINSRKILSKDALEKLKRVESFPGNCAVN